jgi:hypothetical protein
MDKTYPTESRERILGGDVPSRRAQLSLLPTLAIVMLGFNRLAGNRHDAGAERFPGGQCLRMTYVLMHLD